MVDHSADRLHWRRTGAAGGRINPKGFLLVAALALSAGLWATLWLAWRAFFALIG